MSTKPEVNVPKVYSGIFDDSFGRWLSAQLIPHIPAWVTPNQVTVAGFGAALLAAVSYFLGGFERWWLLVAAVCVFLSWLADTVDGDLARTRAQTSERGYFLDEAFDSLAHIAIYLAIAFSTYASFQIVVFAAILHLLHEKLIALWVHLRGEHVFPALAGTQVSLLLICGALLTFLWHQPLVALGDLALGWFDLMVLAGGAWALTELFISGWRLFAQLGHSGR